MPAIKRGDLTMSDMVLLRLLADRPMHGHRASLELKRHQLRTWTGISRPQVYWSLKKLEKMGLICEVDNGESTQPRHRRVFAPTLESPGALNKSLERIYWAAHLPRPLFFAWLVLARDVPPSVIQRQLSRRKKFLQHEIASERAVLRDVREETSATSRRIDWVISLNIKQMTLELLWLRKFQKRISSSNTK